MIVDRAELQGTQRCCAPFIGVVQIEWHQIGKEELRGYVAPLLAPGAPEKASASAVDAPTGRPLTTTTCRGEEDLGMEREQEFVASCSARVWL
jgi:hypothetical protein